MKNKQQQKQVSKKKKKKSTSARLNCLRAFLVVQQASLERLIIVQTTYK